MDTEGYDVLAIPSGAKLPVQYLGILPYLPTKLHQTEPALPANSALNITPE